MRTGDDAQRFKGTEELNAKMSAIKNRVLIHALWFSPVFQGFFAARNQPVGGVDVRQR